MESPRMLSWRSELPCKGVPERIVVADHRQEFRHLLRSQKQQCQARRADLTQPWALALGGSALTRLRHPSPARAGEGKERGGTGKPTAHAVG